MEKHSSNDQQQPQLILENPDDYEEDATNINSEPFSVS